MSLSRRSHSSFDEFSVIKEFFHEYHIQPLPRHEDALMDAAMTLYRASFPSHELRLWADQKAVMSDPAYHFDMCLTDGALAGLILYWDAGSYIYVEHFCVEPNLRGQGLGTLILRALAQQNDKPIILEIDPLVDDVALRRRDFYNTRCGYVQNDYKHIHPPYQCANRGHELITRELSPRHFSGGIRCLYIRPAQQGHEIRRKSLILPSKSACLNTKHAMRSPKSGDIRTACFLCMLLLNQVLLRSLIFPLLRFALGRTLGLPP